MNWTTPEMRKYWLRVAVLILWTALPAAPVAAEPKVEPSSPLSSPAQAAPIPLEQSLSGQARDLFVDARAAYSLTDVPTALIKFQKAHEISGDARLHWNIAICERDQKHYVEARASVEKYLKEGGTLLTPQNRERAGEFLQALSFFISPVELTIDQEGAEVFLDEVKVGVSPLPPWPMNAGKYRLRVSMPGFKDAVRPLEIPGGQRVQLSLALVRDLHEGRLVVEAGPKDLIVLDGRPMAMGRWEGVVPSGGHSLRVTAPGMIAYQSEVVIQDNTTRRIPVTLDPALKPGSSAVWLWVGGGAVATTALVIGGYFLFKPRDPLVTRGSIDPGTSDGSVRLSFGNTGAHLGASR